MQQIVFQRLEKCFFEDYDKQVADVRAALCVPVDPHKRVEVLGRLGMLLLADANTTPQGLRLLTEAYNCSLELGLPRHIARNRIRLATALQYCGTHELALAEFDAALEYICKQKILRMKDFALQHKAKCLVEMGRLAEAVVCFGDALRLRRNRNATDLVRSTVRAMEAVEQMRSNHLQNCSGERDFLP